MAKRNYLLQHTSTRLQTPQSQPVRADQERNEAGGYVWAVDKWTQLRRFLILGAESGSHYQTERDLTKQNIGVVNECVAEDGLRTVNEIVEVSRGGRAPKNDQALYALAVCISASDKDTRVAAGKALPNVARTGTHLFQFCAYAQSMRGWGKVLRKAVAAWYDKNPDQLALQAIKYRQRDGVSSRDPLRLAHPQIADPVKRDIIGFMSGNVGHQQLIENGKITRHAMSWQQGEGTHRLIEGYLRAQQAASPSQTAELVRHFGLPREALKTEHLNDNDVWQAMLDNGMPMTAMIRNLATMTRNGLLTNTSEATKIVLDQLSDQESIRKARVHPFNLFVGMMTYASGRGLRGGNTWSPVGKIVDALDAAFYLAFGNVDPINGTVLIGLDTSGSMQHPDLMGIPGITPARAQAVMALVTVATSPDVEVIGFDTAVYPLALTARQRIDDAYRTSALGHGHGTDVSLPMSWATQMDRKIDAFMVFTDSQTWYGHRHPVEALQIHRQRTGKQSRLATVAMVANRWTVGDTQDPGSMNFVGLDVSTPQLTADFVNGNL